MPLLHRLANCMCVCPITIDDDDLRAPIRCGVSLCLCCHMAHNIGGTRFVPVENGIYTNTPNSPTMLYESVWRNSHSDYSNERSTPHRIHFTCTTVFMASRVQPLFFFLFKCVCCESVGIVLTGEPSSVVHIAVYTLCPTIN